jgi:hypothetical protein
MDPRPRNKDRKKYKYNERNEITDGKYGKPERTNK